MARLHRTDVGGIGTVIALAGLSVAYDAVVPLYVLFVVSAFLCFWPERHG